MFKVTQAERARNSLAALVPRVTSAEQDLSARPEPLLNIGVSWEGLVALGVVGRVGSPDSAREAFPDEFRRTPPSSMGGDWRGLVRPSDLHVTMHLYCNSQESLEGATRDLRSAVGGFEEKGPVQEGDPAITGATLGGAKLHFGYQDGLSQPAVNWGGLPDRPDLIDVRHFVLGYWSPDVQSFPRDGAWADFVRDGSYAAFQWIYQDVATFEQYLSTAAKVFAPELPLDVAKELLASRMMGRWRSGVPVALSPDRDDPAYATANNFGFSKDPKGQSCPLHAHIRLANRRDQELDPAIAPTFRAGGPHLLRRGMAYGKELKGEIDDRADRGLVGMFICANLRKQFFIVMEWINKADFSPLFDPRRLQRQDMIMGDRHSPDAMGASVIRNGVEIALPSLPRFVDIRGTLLLLLPSISGLRRISGLSN